MSTPDTDCPICISFLIEPLKLQCGHAFCRVCLIQSTHVSPSGRKCPLCRSEVNILNPFDCPADVDLTSAVAAKIDSEALHAREAECREVLEQLVSLATSQLPIFAMSPGTAVGAPVSLHFFEPRYKILIRRAWEGNRLFVFSASIPREGADAVVVLVHDAYFLRDGRAYIVGEGVQNVTIGRVWIEDDTQGLAYTEVNVLLSRAIMQRAPVIPHQDSEGTGGDPAPSRGRRPCRTM